MREERTVDALIALVKRTPDVYIATAAAEALAEIGTPRAMRFLESLVNHEARMVREVAEAVFRRGIVQKQASSGGEHNSSDVS
jgi:HEAT repeat protein